ncbi:MAG: SUMF1/EgtB/PvdO family nonheme iron enzyme [Lentisphaeraceae bacterium]|nr:SUMF1/EgtB/PvdO family nonheme iron enzyme [Lentisphaeraceae bacterium]
MPPTDHMHVMSKVETDILKNWIAQGAKWPAGVKLTAQKKQLPETIDFVKHIQPVLEFACISCHGPTKDKGDLRLDTKKWAFSANDDGDKCIIAGKPLESTLYTYMILTEDNDEDDMMMPPAKAKKKGQHATYKEIALIRKWIEQGANFPADAKLMPKKRPVDGPVKTVITPEELFKKLGFDKRSGKTQSVVDYKKTVPGTDVAFDMVAIKGGNYTRGGSDAAEMPKKDVKIGAFWMQRHEMTWEQYELWQFSLDILRRKTIKGYKVNNEDTQADLVSRPTPPYLDMSFGMGKINRPAVCMTQLAAKCYTMWLSAKTGQFYRLATEAEWEYACRAGASTKYSFGDDESKLGDYAWYFDNSDEKYQEIGTKKPNPWGLYDMHGNVAEWVLDTFTADFYISGSVENPINVPGKAGDLNPKVEAIWPTKLYDRIARGGGWDDDPADLRSASRKRSAPDWKIQDPQVPKSVWYHTDAVWVGFRVVRPAVVPPASELHKYWPTAAEIEAIPQR